MEENINNIQDEEKLALRLMEDFDNPSREDLASLEEDGCAQNLKNLMDMEMALRMEDTEHRVDVEAMLQDFHAHKRRIWARRMMIGAGAIAAVLAGLLFLLFGKENEPKAQPVLAQQNYIYKADSALQVLQSQQFEDNQQVAVRQVVAQPGKTLLVVLPDGTEVMLNAGSKLTYPARFDKGRRVVSLYGEAFFKVKKDARHPFVVKSGNVNTTVLGTQFDVKNYVVGAPTVILVEGKVMLTDSLGQKNVTMKPGQSATLDQHGDFALYENTDVEGSLSWKEGYLYYDNVSFYQMMNEIGRWYNIDVVCKNSAVVNSRVHFYVPNHQPLEKTIEMINKLHVAHVTLEGKQVMVR